MLKILSVDETRKCLVVFLCIGTFQACKSRQSILNNQTESNKPASYALEKYRPVAPFTGTLRLPTFTQAPGKENDSCLQMIDNTAGERRPDGGVFIRLDNSAEPELIDKTVWLRFREGSKAWQWAKSVTFDIKFTENTRQSIKNGNIHAPELNCVAKVSPLETLAIGRPFEATQVQLRGNVKVTKVDKSSKSAPAADFILEVDEDPVQISGSHVALIKVTKSPAAHWKDKPAGILSEDYNQAEVVHYNANTGMFDGEKEKLTFWMNKALPKKPERFTLSGIEKDPLNEEGWFAYGNMENGRFMVSSLEPRALLRVPTQPSKGIVYGLKRAASVVDTENFLNTQSKKGQSWTMALHPFDAFFSNASGKLLANDIQTADAQVMGIYSEGARFLVSHLFGGLRGENGDAPVPLDLVVTGHSSFGDARVIKAPFTGSKGELKFDITYRQVYTHNPEGIISGTIAWHEYQGNLRRGWVWSRPVSDSLIYLPYLTGNLSLAELTFNGLDGQIDEAGRQGLLGELEKMTARVRAGDGTQVSSVTPFSSCVQNSAKAFYIAIRRLEEGLIKSPKFKEQLKNSTQSNATAIQKLFDFSQYLKDDFVFAGKARADWEKDTDQLVPIFDNSNNNETAAEKSQWLDFIDLSTKSNLLSKMPFVRTMIPRYAHDRFLKATLGEGATIWMIRTNQIGGHNPDIWPAAPTSLTIKNH